MMHNFPFKVSISTHSTKLQLEHASALNKTKQQKMSLLLSPTHQSDGDINNVHFNLVLRSTLDKSNPDGG